ncbi:MAG: SGNH/GDSL hydrolase family protein [Oligoflexales bacterium]
MIGYVLSFLVVFGLIGCKQNLYEEKTQKKNSLARVSKYLEEQKPEDALLLLIADLDEGLREKLLRKDFSDETLEQLAHGVNFDPQRLNLFSSTYANIAGVDIVNLALKIEKFKTENPNSNLLIQELLPLFSGKKEDIVTINFARKIKEIITDRGESDEIYIATLTTAEILFSLKSFDLDGDFDVSPEESMKINIDDIERLYDLIQKLINDSNSIEILSENSQVKKVLERFEKINEKIDNVLKDGNKEKLKVVVKGILREVQDKEFKIEVPPPKESMKAAPKSLDIQVDQDDRRLVQSMVVFGDSMAVGVGVAYQKGQELTTEELAYHPGIEEALKQQGDTSSKRDQKKSDLNIIQSFDGAYSATGETIKRCSEIMDENCYSHAARLKVEYLKNYAMSGSKIQDVLQIQLPLFLKSKSHADYVVVNIGGNDFCSNNFDKNVFVDCYKQVLTSLYNLESKPVILLVPPPSITKVFSSLNDSSPAFSILDEETESKADFICGDIRWVFCPRAALNRENLESQAHIIDEIIEGVNRAVAKVQDPKEQKRIFIARELSQFEVTPDIIGIDCFHPNKEGYIKIANTSFKAVEDKLKANEQQSE